MLNSDYFYLYFCPIYLILQNKKTPVKRRFSIFAPSKNIFQFLDDVELHQIARRDKEH
jgi:hypothetical protein